MSLELRHLRAMVELADTESFTVAASNLAISQPTLSRTIAQLESLVGTELVHRSTRAVRLTENGWDFVVEARSMLEQLDRLVARFEQKVGPLRVGWAWAGLGRHTHGLLRAWQASSSTPLEINRPDDPLLALERSRIDLAIVKRSAGEADLPAGLDVTPLFSESLVAAISIANPLAEHPAVSLDEIAEHPVTLCSVSPTASLRLWDGRAVVPAPLLADNNDQWLMDVVLDKAVGVTSAATTFTHPHPEVIYRRISDSPEVEVSIVRKAGATHPVSAEFAAFTRAYFESLRTSANIPRRSRAATSGVVAQSGRLDT